MIKLRDKYLKHHNLFLYLLSLMTKRIIIYTKENLPLMHLEFENKKRTINL